MQTWQYKIESVNISERWSPKKQAQELASLEDTLNGLGAQGWELVGYESIPLTGTFSNNVKGYAYLAFFKKPD